MSRCVECGIGKKTNIGTRCQPCSVKHGRKGKPATAKQKLGSSKRMKRTWVENRRAMVAAQSAGAMRRWQDPSRNHANAKLTDDQVRAVRASGETTRALSTQLGISWRVINGARRRRTYRWVK